MTDRSDGDALSSEELIRRARDGLGTPPPAVEDSGAAATPDPAVEEPAPPAAPPPHRAPTPPPPPAPKPADADRYALLPEHFKPESVAPEPSAPSGFAAGLASKWGWILAGLFGLFLVYNFLTSDTSVDDLAVGDCFLAPSEDEISTVETVDCAELHDYEVFAFVVLADRAGGFPGDTPLFEEADDKCFAPYLAYIGGDIDNTQYVYDVFIPGPSSWDAGNRESMCAIFAIDEDFNAVSTLGTARGE